MCERIQDAGARGILRSAKKNDDETRTQNPGNHMRPERNMAVPKSQMDCHSIQRTKPQTIARNGQRKYV
eukprot:2134030-Karenia_brevis.AAC.1